MEYTFVKIRSVIDKESKGTWYLLADTVDTIKEHFNVYGKAYFKEGIENFINHSDKMGHYTSRFAYLISITMMTPENQGVPWPIVATKIENDMYQSRLNGYLEGRKQYLGKEMAVLVDNPSIEIVETIVKDKMVYPDDEKLTMDDVRYLQWYGGKHWYAKVGKLDIVDKDGNQKWDTKKEAEEAARWFINNNN